MGVFGPYPTPPILPHAETRLPVARRWGPRMVRPRIMQFPGLQNLPGAAVWTTSRGFVPRAEEQAPGWNTLTLRGVKALTRPGLGAVVQTGFHMAWVAGEVRGRGLGRGCRVGGGGGDPGARRSRAGRGRPLGPARAGVGRPASLPCPANTLCAGRADPPQSQGRKTLWQNGVGGKAGGLRPEPRGGTG
jgi:hypothetical protein